MSWHTIMTSTSGQALWTAWNQPYAQRRAALDTDMVTMNRKAATPAKLTRPNRVVTSKQATLTSRHETVA